MDKKETLADVQQEGTPIVDTPEKTGTESQPENKQTVKEPSQEGETEKDNTLDENKLPFHKHPRWIARENKIKEYESEISELRHFREEAEPLLKGLKDQNVEMPDWWKTTYGDSEDSLKAYRIYLDNNKKAEDSITDKVLNRIEEKSSKEIQAEKQSEESLKIQVAEMKDEGTDFDEHKLAQFLLDYE